ncbi:MAG: toll/interleukin-1 receptor domain-containing protein [Ruminococcaceae bacterium]|nr:toll/interleukin-1 receptor domain-containing protein [Oscillospiraceae bacterium]
MAIFKCKMCGGTLEVNNETVAVCQYCGTKQTLPKLDDDRKANLYDRANHFRRNNEFDKAMGIYEQILNDDNTDAESYWSLVLCRYGIEYVEDPTSHKRIPTVNRAQFTSVFDDEDYKSALQYADGYQKAIYEQEAAAINEIQKGILAISGREEPFDVFICYKESDNNGRRTPDSVLATELYHELVREGFKVFFSRITLEDKLGQEYEPYIFAALNSAKVMVVLGTKPEYFNAVWVKNEWSRYLALIKNGARKILIPAYKDMDPYDLPEEFSHLQAQDMSKLGFLQDLTHVINKLIENNTKNHNTYITTNSQESSREIISVLLKKAYILLGDGEFKKANSTCEKILDYDPENALVYLYKLMIDYRIKKREDLSSCFLSFENNKNYKKAITFGNNELKLELKEYINSIKKKDEIRNNKRKLWLNNFYKKVSKILLITSIVVLLAISIGLLVTKIIIPNRTYKLALEAINEKDYITAYETLGTLEDYKDSVKLSNEIYFDYNLQKIKKSNIGDTISLGGFYYDWSVAYKDDSKVLLLCNQLLQCTGDTDDYNASNGDINLIGGWEKSSLRTYLNDEFYRKEVPSFLHDYIVKETVNDNIFILSSGEFIKYNILSPQTQILRDVDVMGYTILQGNGNISKVRYASVPGWPDGKLSNSKITEYFNKHRDQINRNREIRFANYRPAMWVDISGIE